MHPIIKAYTEQIKKLHDEIDVLKQENIELEQRLDDEMLRTTQLATENIKLEKKLENIKDVCDECSSCSKINDILQIIESEEDESK